MYTLGQEYRARLEQMDSERREEFLALWLVVIAVEAAREYRYDRDGLRMIEAAIARLPHTLTSIAKRDAQKVVKAYRQESAARH